MLCIHCRAEVGSTSGTCPKCGNDLANSSSPTAAGVGPGKNPTVNLNPGQSFGERYTIVEEVGAGGMGQVYKAMDRELGRTVALKLIPPFPEGTKMVERFRRELNLAREVTHPNVCRVFDWGESAGIRFISMEYVDGQNLHDWIQAVGHLSPHQTMAVAKQICDGLESIHIQNIIHRDLKPSNIMLDRPGRAVVMDFGLAYHPDTDHITAKGEALGTLAYLSPEQARGTKVDSRSDIYTLGLVLFEMLTGKRAPADGKRLPLALRDREEICPPPSRISPEVSRSLDTIVLRCVERAPEDRFQTVGEIRNALEKCESEAAGPPSQEEPAPRPRKSRGLWYGLGAAGAAVFVMLLIRAISPVAAPHVSSLAILPHDYDGPPATSYMESLIPLVLIRNLQELPDLQVVPFESSRLFDSGEDSRRVVEQLGVGSSIQGKVTIDGEVLELQLALVTFDDEGESHWTAQYVGELSNVLETVDRASSEIIGALGRQSAGGGQSAERSRRALEHYLEGKRRLEGWDVGKNPELAVEAFTRALEEEEGFAAAHAGLALALWRSYVRTGTPDLVDRALEEANRAISVDPSLPEGHLALGVLQLGQGRTVEAAASFQKVVELAPANDHVCRRIAAVYANLGRFEDADQMYDRAIALRPAFWQSYNSKGNFYLNHGEIEKAKPLFQRVIELRPDSDTGYTNLAATHLLVGELREAEPLLLAAIRIHPGPEAHNNLGFVYYGSGRFDEAAEHFREAVRQAPDHYLPWGGLADAYRQLGQNEVAHEAYTRAVELAEARLGVNTKEAEARAFLAMCFAGLDDCSDSSRQAAVAAVDEPRNPFVHYYVAIAYMVCGKRPEALRHTIRALEEGGAVDVRTNPDLQPLLEEPEVQALLR